MATCRVLGVSCLLKIPGAVFPAQVRFYYSLPYATETGYLIAPTISSYLTLLTSECSKEAANGFLAPKTMLINPGSCIKKTLAGTRSIHSPHEVEQPRAAFWGLLAY